MGADARGPAVSRDAWAAYAGSLSDDPAETRGLPVVEPDGPDLWLDMSELERALATLRTRALSDRPRPVDRHGWPAERQS